jgi:voltage-gated potassium channel
MTSASAQLPPEEAEEPTRQPRSAEPGKGKRPLLPALRLRGSAVWLLVFLGCLFILSPFIEDLPRGKGIEICLVTLVMIFAVLSVGYQGRTLVTAFVLVIPAMGARWLYHLYPTGFSPVYYLVLGTIFFAFVVLQILRAVLHTPTVDANVLCAGLAGYLLLGLLWVPAYMLTAQVNPAAFTISSEQNAHMDGFHSFYFSFITLCTVGYGDVVPVSKVARTLAILEAIVGLFYVAVFISRLVAIYSSPAPAPNGGQNREQEPKS